jgi:hypothetical protein
MQAWCDSKGLDTVIHPIPKCVIFLEDLLQEMVDKKSKDPFGTIRVARKAVRHPMQHLICKYVHSQGASKRCATTLWGNVQQGDLDQVCQQQSFCSHY